ncbi:MAG: autotransporter outer membrane beta-barrel domain-containing protein, partial [Megasphaera sp.]|nr:autotransporter outer membrane beta-barrel domain-containing protein [Megasphaera sp.]
MKKQIRYFTEGVLQRKVLKTLVAGMAVLPMAAAGSIVEASTTITSGTHDIGGEYTIDRDFAMATGNNIVLNGTDNVKITSTSTGQGFFGIRSGGKISLDMQGNDFAYEGKYYGMRSGEISTPTSTWNGTTVIDNVHDFDAAIVASGRASIISAFAYGDSSLFEINATGKINMDISGSNGTVVGLLSSGGNTSKVNLNAVGDINISGDGAPIYVVTNNAECNVDSTEGDINLTSRSRQGVRNNGGTINIKGQTVTIDALTKGIDARGGTTNVTATKGDVTIGNATAQAIHAEGTGSVDITSEQGKINLTATKTDDSTYPNAGIYTADTGAVNLHSDTVITAAEKSIDATGGTVTFDKALTATAAPTAIAASGGAVVTATDSATDKQIAGTITADGSGTAVNVDFPTSASYFTGSTDVTNDGAVNLGFSNHSIWNLTADSKLTSLDNTNSTINMHYTGDDTYETITTDTYSGSNGTLLMDTDLASETNGDKLYINNSGAGGGTIQVFDKSLNSGTKVNAKDDWTKTKLLLVGGNGADGTTWTGQTLDTGGLWELTPTVEKLEDNQWYLTMMKRSANPSTKTIMGSLDSAYGLWRYDDTLRKRLGDLRYIDNDQNGLWVRLKAGKLAADSYDGNYQMYQIGYDKKSDNTIYGIAVDHSKASNDYYAGDGDNSMTNLTLYATNYRGGVDVKNQKSGSTYSDLVLRAGRLQSNVDSYGTYHDSLGYDTWGYNISYEMGKTFRNDNGWFIEPEAQLSYGRLRGGDYTTQRGTHVHKDDIDSLLGRIGFVAGRKINDDKDFYFKANVYREFAGDGDMRFVHGDQTMLDDVSNRDTWFEMGVGGNIRLANDTYMYGDVLKTFGADINKKWQVNLGLRWAFGGPKKEKAVEPAPVVVEPTPVPAPAPVRETYVDSVHFDFDVDTPKAEEMHKIDQFAKAAKANPDRTYAVVGNTDSVGTDEYNLALSQRRAENVK